MANAAANSPGDFASMFLPFVLMLGALYFFIIRPQQKKQKARMLMLNDLQKGDKVTTIGGLHGVVSKLSDDEVVLTVAPGMEVIFERSAINTITNNEEEKEKR